MTKTDVDSANLSFVEEIYATWKQNPQSVATEWQTWLEHIENGHVDIRPKSIQPTVTRSADSERDDSYKQVCVDRLIWAYRDIGYLYATLNPLGDYSTPELKYLFYTTEGLYQNLNIEKHGLSKGDLDRHFTTGGYFDPDQKPLRELLSTLQQTYCSNIGIEMQHIQNKSMRRWLIQRIEGPRGRRNWSSEQKIRLQKDLIKAEACEHFIHSHFVGQKRFSLEGSEALIPALRYLIDSAVEHNLQEIVLGMSHRGRLNVFTNALRKPGVETFADFIDNYMPHTYGGSGDVKYHLGHSFDLKNTNGKIIHISLVANPSHLESVDPVVEGKCRGIQRRRGDRNRKKVIPVLIHGDAAFSGQGVVAETFNLSQLRGYRTGGTIHIIVNNQIGFTTASRDSRSTYFATDIAKSMPIPIFHVNGNDPEAVIRGIDLAMHYRQKFGHDAVVDIICYRRLGHNEADEPSFTHPIMYSTINSHKSTCALYAERLDREGVYPHEEQERFHTQYVEVLKEELDKAKSGYKPNMDDAFMGGDWVDFIGSYSFNPVDTTVSQETLRQIGEKLLEPPHDFSLHPKLQRFVKQRRQMLETDGGIDWSLAESLAFGSLLLEGYPIRLSGEDCSRGTFSQRHAVWWDTSAAAPRRYTPFRNLSSQQAEFSIYDSPLSEFAVLGFDYGYSLAQPNVLVIWEAQFGDFVNGAQVVIDQFIAAAESKWHRFSGIVLLLPHGYEGQGPEHSSAHLERFLQLCAGNNMQVVYPSTPAQYFHLLRRQMKQSFRKPLIVMTPKSLLRNKRCVSNMEQLSEGGFQCIYDDTIEPANALRLLLCSGKIYYDLAERRMKTNQETTAIVRFEQLYPFPEQQIGDLLDRYPKDIPIVWCQEEPRNRGAWSFIREQLGDLLRSESLRLSCVSRPASQSPATGSYRQHAEELQDILQKVFEK